MKRVLLFSTLALILLLTYNVCIALTGGEYIRIEKGFFFEMDGRYYYFPQEIEIDQTAFWETGGYEGEDPNGDDTDPPPPPPPPPQPTPSKDNAFNSCMTCHSDKDEAKFKFENWKTTLHTKHREKKIECIKCHKLD